MGIRIQIEASALNIPAIRCRRDIARTHVHNTVRFDQIGMPGIAPVAEDLFLNRRVRNFLARENGQAHNEKESKDRNKLCFHKGGVGNNRISKTVPREYKNLSTFILAIVTIVAHKI